MDTDVNNKKPLVSVIMAAHNAEKYIAEAIESILSQTYQNWELLITDDASTDSTRAIIIQYEQKDPRIKIIPLDESVRQTIARIKAIEISSGEYLAVLDADDISLPDRLTTQVDFLESHPDIIVVGSDADLIDAVGKIIGRKGKSDQNTEIAFRLLLQTQFIHSAVCMRRDAYEAIGGYDRKRYFNYAEEYDLWNRFAHNGYRLANIKEKLIQYRINPEGVSMTDTSGIRAGLSTDVSEQYTNYHIKLPREKVKLLTDFVNGRRLSILRMFRALFLYKKLVLAYLREKDTSLTKPEKNLLWGLYTDLRRYTIHTSIKRLLGIT
ncbi:MAG: glycosyltransferase [Patescibacteria group bacterium]